MCLSVYARVYARACVCVYEREGVREGVRVCVLTSPPQQLAGCLSAH
jgi:hypothetical protein